MLKCQPEKECVTCGIRYMLSRSKKRRSVAIEIRDGVVRVKAPNALSAGIIENFVARKSEWVNKKLSLWNKRNEELSAVQNFHSFLLHGVRYTGKFSAVKTIALCDDALLLPIKLQGNPNRLLHAVQRFYKKYANQYLSERMQELADRNGFSFRSFRLTNAMRKWGSCTGEGDVSLNWRLVLLEKSWSDYVILHELCHTQYHNHGRKYWFLVETACPYYQKARKALKENSLIIHLYR